jgi:hypothetical protein
MQRKSKPVVETRFIMTNRGLMKATVADFDPAKYQGLKKNCGRPIKNANTK